jgi:hypothetical protein
VPPENGNIILSQNDKPLTSPLRNGLLFLYGLVDKISHKNFFSPTSFDVSIDVAAAPRKNNLATTRFSAAAAKAPGDDRADRTIG